MSSDLFLNFRIVGEDHAVTMTAGTSCGKVGRGEVRMRLARDCSVWAVITAQEGASEAGLRAAYGDQ
jgi:hypothetical protein